MESRQVLILPKGIEWEHIPQAMKMADQTLRHQAAPLDQVLAVLEVVVVSLRTKIESHMSDWDAPTILSFGVLLQEIDAKLELAGDALIIHENVVTAEGHMWPVFALIYQAWEKLMGVTEIGK